MSRTCIYFGFAALVLALCLAGRGAAQDGEADKAKAFKGSEKPPPASPSETEGAGIAGLTQSIKNLTSRFDVYQKDLETVREKVKTLDGAYRETLKIPGIEGELKRLGDAINNLSSRIDNLQNDINQLNDRIKNQETRVARSLEPQAAGGTTSTIKLQNRSGVTVTVVVDNRGYVVGPYQTRLLERRPVGGFTYEVLADTFGVIQPVQNRTLAPDEVFTIQINPSR